MVVAANLAVMIHYGAGIDDAVWPNPGTGLKDGTRHDLSALCQHRMVGNDGPSADYLGKAITQSSIMGE
ncbi:hypothetical protein D3C79_963660 [compost metagenome]